MVENPERDNSKSLFARANCFTAESVKKLILSGGGSDVLSKACVQPQRNVYYIYNLKQNLSVFARRIHFFLYYIRSEALHVRLQLSNNSL